MKTIVAGSREGVSIDDVRKAMSSCGWEISEVVSGAARGADRYGEEVAGELGIQVKRFPADWAKYGKEAGHIRNILMAQNAEALVAVWDGKSSGTRDMIRIAKMNGLKVFVYKVG
jgi:hypothetical protein